MKEDTLPKTVLSRRKGDREMVKHLEGEAVGEGEEDPELLPLVVLTPML